MTIYGGQQYTAMPTEMIRSELTKLRGVLAGLGPDPDARSSALSLLAAADHQASRRQPDPRLIARPLEQMTSMLPDAGILAAAGVQLIAPIRQIATWLGAAGHAIIQLL